MPNSRTISIFTFLLLMMITLNACLGNKPANSNADSPNSNQNPSSEIVVQDNVEELGKIVKLLIVPEETTYTEINTPAKNSELNGKRLVAVLKFNVADAASIVAAAEKYKSPAPSDVDAETWFPPELVAKSQETGDEFLKGIEYAPNDFVQPPYLNGKLTRINDTNYFVLELTSF